MQQLVAELVAGDLVRAPRRRAGRAREELGLEERAVALDGREGGSGGGDQLTGLVGVRQASLRQLVAQQHLGVPRGDDRVLGPDLCRPVEVLRGVGEDLRQPLELFDRSGHRIGAGRARAQQKRVGAPEGEVTDRHLAPQRHLLDLEQLQLEMAPEQIAVDALGERRLFVLSLERRELGQQDAIQIGRARVLVGCVVLDRDLAVRRRERVQAARSGAGHPCQGGAKARRVVALEEVGEGALGFAQGQGPDVGGRLGDQIAGVLVRGKGLRVGGSELVRPPAVEGDLVRRAVLVAMVVREGEPVFVTREDPGPRPVGADGERNADLALRAARDLGHQQLAGERVVRPGGVVGDAFETLTAESGQAVEELCPRVRLGARGVGGKEQGGADRGCRCNRVERSRHRDSVMRPGRRWAGRDHAGRFPLTRSTRRRRVRGYERENLHPSIARRGPGEAGRRTKARRPEGDRPPRRQAVETVARARSSGDRNARHELSLPG